MKKTKTLPLPNQNIILALGSQKCIQAEMMVQSESNEVVTARPLTLPCHTRQLVTSVACWAVPCRKHEGTQTKQELHGKPREERMEVCKDAVSHCLDSVLIEISQE